jgi:hypothetical protein
MFGYCFVYCLPWQRHRTSTSGTLHTICCLSGFNATSASEMINWYLLCVLLTMCDKWTHGGDFSALPRVSTSELPDEFRWNLVWILCYWRPYWTPKVKVKLPCKRPWRLIGLWEVEAPTFSRQSAHRWRWGCQSYAPAALYPPGRFLALISIIGRVYPGP